MNWQKTLILTICVSFVATAALAQCGGKFPCSDKKPAAKTEAKPAAAPAKAPADAPAAKPAPKLSVPPKATLPPLPEVVATVGATKITGKQVDKVLSTLPPNVPARQVMMYRQKVIGELMFTALLNNYMKANKIEYSKESLAEIKAMIEKAAKRENITPEELMKKAGFTEEDLKDQARGKQLFEQTTSDAKAAEFVKTHPDCFNGTEVKASHILLQCSPLAPTAEQKKLVAQLEQIAADIKAGKTTFSDAANKFSVCPSGKTKGKDGKGDSYGDLGFFAFAKGGRMLMAPPFAVAAFETKVGETTGVVRTQFGFHLIKVTDRKEGKAPQDPKAMDIAKQVLASEVQNKVINQALTTCPITVTKEQPAAKKVTVKKSAK